MMQPRRQRDGGSAGGAGLRPAGAGRLERFAAVKEGPVGNLGSRS